MAEDIAAPPALNELMDRQEWHDNVDAHVTYAEQNNKSLTVVFADVNLFKLVNDVLGHNVGDVVIDDIKQAVSFLAGELRIGDGEDEGRDVVSYNDPNEHAPLSPSAAEQSINAYGGHVGGDEVAIIAETDAAGAQAIAGRLRTAFNEYIDRPENAQLKELGIGLSIGTATLEPGMDAHQLLRKADDAMYQDKLEQLPPLSPEQEAVLRRSKADIEAHGLRIRDLIKYELLLNLQDEQRLQEPQAPDTTA